MYGYQLNFRVREFKNMGKWKVIIVKLPSEIKTLEHAKTMAAIRVKEVYPYGEAEYVSVKQDPKNV